ncbi:hypothetical protein BHE74_00048481, partial [Ensete ventricosum]
RGKFLITIYLLDFLITNTVSWRPPPGECERQQWLPSTSLRTTLGCSVARRPLPSPSCRWRGLAPCASRLCAPSFPPSQVMIVLSQKLSPPCDCHSSLMLSLFFSVVFQESTPSPATTSRSGPTLKSTAPPGGFLVLLPFMLHYRESSFPIQEANIAKETKQFTYKDGSQFVFMDLATYEETRLTEAEVGEKTKWLKEGMDCNVVFWNGRVFLVSGLAMVRRISNVCVNKIQIAGGSKPATLDTGAVINVPLFVNTGEEILVDTRTGQYTSRA